MATPPPHVGRNPVGVEVHMGDLIPFKTFEGTKDNDIDKFLSNVEISFQPREAQYLVEATKEKARLMYLATIMDGKARKWWRSIDRSKRDTWEKATTLLRTKYGDGKLISGEVTEWTRACAEFSELKQGNKTNEDYVKQVKELSGILGDRFNAALATKFVTGMKEPTIQKVVYGQLDDKFNLDQAVKAFLRATRDDRTVLA